MSPYLRLPKLLRSRSILSLSFTGLLLLSVATWAGHVPAEAEPEHGTMRLHVVGGLADVRLYQDYERSFWRDELPILSDGRLQADIVPFDSSGIRGQDMLHLLRLGVLPFGTVLLSLAANDEPELAAPNLAMLAPDIGTLRRVVQAYRSHLGAVLKDRYGLELLAIYAYPAQVLFCTEPMQRLDDLRGRRVRVSNPSQADAMGALGAISVQTPFNKQLEELRSGRIDCAITGSLSGNQIGLHRLTQQVHPMAISWGLSVFAANEQAWMSLPEDLRQALRRGLARLELNVWAAAGQDTEDGFLCNAGRPGCQAGTPGSMIWEGVTAEDETTRRRLLSEAVIPGWIARCGDACVEVWNTYLGPLTRIFLPQVGPGPAQAERPGGPQLMNEPHWETIDPGAGSAIPTGGPADSITAPASSSTSSR